MATLQVPETKARTALYDPGRMLSYMIRPLRRLLLLKPDDGKQDRPARMKWERQRKMLARLEAQAMQPTSSLMDELHREIRHRLGNSQHVGGVIQSATMQLPLILPLEEDQAAAEIHGSILSGDLVKAEMIARTQLYQSLISGVPCVQAERLKWYVHLLYFLMLQGRRAEGLALIAHESESQPSIWQIGSLLHQAPEWAAKLTMLRSMLSTEVTLKEFDAAAAAHALRMIADKTSEADRLQRLATVAARRLAFTHFSRLKNDEGRTVRAMRRRAECCADFSRFMAELQRAGLEFVASGPCSEERILEAAVALQQEHFLLAFRFREYFVHAFAPIFWGHSDNLFRFLSQDLSQRRVGSSSSLSDLVERSPAYKTVVQRSIALALLLYSRDHNQHLIDAIQTLQAQATYHGQLVEICWSLELGEWAKRWFPSLAATTSHLINRSEEPKLDGWPPGAAYGP